MIAPSFITDTRSRIPAHRLALEPAHVDREDSRRRLRIQLCLPVERDGDLRNHLPGVEGVDDERRHDPTQNRRRAVFRVACGNARRATRRAAVRRAPICAAHVAFAPHLPAEELPAWVRKIAAHDDQDRIAGAHDARRDHVAHVERARLGVLSCRRVRRRRLCRVVAGCRRDVVMPARLSRRRVTLFHARRVAAACARCECEAHENRSPHLRYHRLSEREMKTAVVGVKAPRGAGIATDCNSGRRDAGRRTRLARRA
jgi:hypothetical protein